MDWRKALDVVIARTKHERYRDLCADDNPHCWTVRRRMIERATGQRVTCQNCPCPSSCLRWPIFCDWASIDPPRDERLLDICARSGHRGAFTVPGGTPDPRPSGLVRELVVSRYREGVEWLDGVPNSFHVSLYDKSSAPYLVARQVRRERLPNVGRETYSMLHHIVAYYDSLADWTYFVQGDAPRHAPDILGRLKVPYQGLCSLTRTYTETDPSPEVHAGDAVEWHGGYEVRYGDWPVIPGMWPHVFACPQPERNRMGYAAQWAVPRANLLSRPRSFWRWLRDEVARGRFDAQPQSEGWTMEPLWFYLFSGPEEWPHRADAVAEEPVYPSPARQAGNALAAAGRVVMAAARGEPVRASPEVYRRRLEICQLCEFNGLRPTGVRCTKCGCGTMKLELATEKCPVNKW